MKPALANFQTLPLKDAARELLERLGYKSKRFLIESGSKPQVFLDNFASDHAFDQNKALVSEWKSADLLFQFTEQELRREPILFPENSVNASLLTSYVFIAIELKDSDYPRGKFSAITRQINRLFPMPVMVIFKHGDRLTIAVINRRRNKIDDSKDVLEKATLICDIKFNNPHRGHLDILSSLSLPNLVHPQKKPISDFDTLHAAWEQIFNIELLNVRFYKELANWYFWALPQVEFPSDLEPDDEKRRATGLIRLLTRLIFCWFLKEKNLIPEKLFHPTDLAKILKGFDPESETSSTYYQAILQNLFFATLNQRMGKDGNGKPYRVFAKDEGFAKNRSTYDVNNLYRYEALFRDEPDAALAHFADIPFLNGGLFECLDRTEDGTEKKRYLDGFSRNSKKRPHVPDRLFFDSGETADLSTAYGDKKHKAEKVTGLITILNRYKFTIVENTPIDQEIALDPELLGKVFENLLASYNEETKTTARKQTGSFYTPRPIVDYMVDESLKAHFTRALVDKASMKEPDARAGLDILFAYTEKEHAFTPPEVTTLITSIDALKILDPACGSGAFPMGVLHKLVYCLGKLDPDNGRWKQTQLAKLDSAPIREELERAFADNNDDYGRKLYLIENCLYGVDIQPIAIQITKLRFFISLVCDQKTNRNKKDNHGIRPLPNLETKFVAADSLIGLPEITPTLLVYPRIGVIEKEIEFLYHSHFSIQRRDQKLALQRKIKSLRQELGKHLAQSLMTPKKSQHLADWDPFDPQSSADFFDPHWMFGRSLQDGFDIVIGNPPYGAELPARVREILSANFPLVPDKESSHYFICVALKVLKESGIKSFIIPNTWLVNRFAKKLRKHFLETCSIGSIIDCSNFPVFEAASVRNSITMFSKLRPETKHVVRFSVFQPEEGCREPKDIASSLLFDGLDNWLTFFSSGDSKMSLSEKIRAQSKPLSAFSASSQGLIPYDKYRGHDEKTIKNRIWHAEFRKDSTFKMELQGKDVDRYLIDWNGTTWISYGDWLAAPRNPKFFRLKRILIREITNPRILAAYTEDEYYNTPSIINVVEFRGIDPYYLLGILNSRLLSFYHIETSPKSKKGLFPKILVNDVRNLPIKQSDPQTQKAVAKLVTAVMAQKAKSCGDTFAQEAEIDRLVYSIYGLIPEEIKLVEESVPVARGTPEPADESTSGS